MNENRISIELSADDVAKINQAIQILTDVLQPVLIALDADDKRNMVKLGDKSVSFVEKAMQYVESNPEFLPPYMSVGEIKKDYTGFSQLKTVLRPLLQIIGNIDDTAALCGSEAFLAALAYYNSVSLAAKMKVPNAQAIYDDLSPRFAAQRANKPKPKPPVPPVTT